MKRMLLRVVVASLFLALATPAAAQQPTGPKDRGFVLEVGIGSRLLDLNLGLGGSYTLAGVEGGFFAGYKLNRLMIGASFDFERISVDQGTNPRTTNSDSVFTIMPGVRFALLRSADERVELFGQVDFGYGHGFIDNGNDHNRIVYQLGPGLRLWFHPSFAVGALVGLRGDFDLEEGSGGTTTAITSIFARFTFTGVF